MPETNGQSNGGGKPPRLPHVDVRNPKTGKFEKGHRGGGRPFKSVDGIKAFRALVSKHVGEMSEEGADIDAFINEIRSQGSKGAWWIIKNIVMPMMKAETKTDVNIEGASSVQVNMYLEKPTDDQIKSVESRSVDARRLTNGQEG